MKPVKERNGSTDVSPKAGAKLKTLRRTKKYFRHFFSEKTRHRTQCADTQTEKIFEENKENKERIAKTSINKTKIPGKNRWESSSRDFYGITSSGYTLEAHLRTFQKHQFLVV